MNDISKQRVLAALNHEIPDRVPSFEWLVDQRIIDVLMPGADYYGFCEQYMDAVCVDLTYKKTHISDTRTQNEWGIIYEDTCEAHPYPIDGSVHNMAELEAYVPPKANVPERYEVLKDALARFDNTKAVILHMNDVWSLPSRLMPFDDFIMNIIDEPDFIKKMIKITVDAQIAIAEQAAKCGAKFIYTGDDVAYNSGPMISPAMFEAIFFPELKRIVGAYKDLGFYVLKHTDGYMMPLMDMYVAAGFDLFDPIDPIAGMSLAVMKKQYGDVIALKGNVNCATTLVSGSVDDTVREVKECLKVGMPGGGYIISSSNTIHSSINPKNYRAMIDTIETHGKY